MAAEAGGAIGARAWSHGAPKVVGGRLQRALKVTAAEVDQETEGLLCAPARPASPLTAPMAEVVEGDNNNNTAGQGAAAAAPEAAGGAPAEDKETPDAQVAMDTDEKDASEAENS
jgi:hypothetical protein